MPPGFNRATLPPLPVECVVNAACMGVTMYLNREDFDSYLPRLQALWPWEEVGIQFRSHDGSQELTIGWGTTRHWFSWLTYLDPEGEGVAGENDEAKVAALAKALAASLFAGQANATDFTLRSAGSHVVEMDGRIALLRS